MMASQFRFFKLHLAAFWLFFSQVARSAATSNCGSASSDGRTIGYYEGWNTIDRTCEIMQPAYIPLGYYTHINFAFVLIDPNSFNIVDMNQSIQPLYDQVSALKQRQPGLQTWISIGGSSFNNPGPTQTTFSNLAASTSAQSSFFSSLITFMKTHNFDGVDIDWEYPGAPDRGGTSADVSNFVSFLQNLRNALDGAGFSFRPGLSIAIPATSTYLQYFDLVKIQPIVDWFNTMTYDLHGVWDVNSPTGNHVESHTDLSEIKQDLQYLWNNNINPSQVSLGLAFYGRSFTLSDPSCKAAGCPFSGGGNPGPCTETSGILSSIEIRNEISTGALVTLDTSAAAEIVTWGSNQWVSYDDGTTLKLKQQYANQVCIGGTAIWAIDLDDGTLINALGSNMNRQKATVKS